MRNKTNLAKFWIGMSFMVLLLMVATISMGNTPEPTMTPTEAGGGMIGTKVDELRCPINLSGIGPTWNGIEIGVSGPEGLAEYFSSEGEFATPYQPYAGDYAPNYKFHSNELGTVFVCIVDGKVAALLIDLVALNETNMPTTMQHWIAFLGRPELMSWHQSADLRLFHWPKYGISISAWIPQGVSTYADTEWLYLYPFRGDDYENLWPVNRIWNEQPLAIDNPDIALDVVDLDAIELTVTAKAWDWPMATPYVVETQEPAYQVAATAVP